jgi:hypothetical protein
VPAVTSSGPALYDIGIVAMNRSGFGNVRSVALWWTVLVGTCGAMTTRRDAFRHVAVSGTKESEVLT